MSARGNDEGACAPPRFRHAPRFWYDRRGAAAIEFAMVVPLLLCMYFMTAEFGQAIETKMKIGRAASMIGLVLSQQDKVTMSDLEGIMVIGQAGLQPYARTKPTITVTGLKVSNDPTPRALVQWSRSLANGNGTTGMSKGDEVTLPGTLMTPGKFIIYVTTTLDYRPMIAWAPADRPTLGLMSAFTSIQMMDKTYQEPRNPNDITCTDC